MASRELLRPAESVETLRNAAAGRLRVVYRDEPPMGAPLVQTRDLAVYEEAAHAASLG